MKQGISIKAVCCLLLLTLTRCESVKPYQKQLLNDDSMQPNSTSIEKLDSEAESYREGASGGTGGRNGGGCGCN